jgi:hypothetical protein
VLSEYAACPLQQQAGDQRLPRAISTIYGWSRKRGANGFNKESNMFQSTRPRGARPGNERAMNDNVENSMVIGAADEYERMLDDKERQAEAKNKHQLEFIRSALKGDMSAPANFMPPVNIVTKNICRAMSVGEAMFDAADYLQCFDELFALLSRSARGEKVTDDARFLIARLAEKSAWIHAEQKGAVA